MVDHTPMMRILSLALVVTISIAVIGCSQPDAPVATPPAATATSSGKGASVGSSPKPMLTQGAQVQQMGGKAGGN